MARRKKAAPVTLAGLLQGGYESAVLEIDAAQNRIAVAANVTAKAEQTTIIEAAKADAIGQAVEVLTNGGVI